MPGKTICHCHLSKKRFKAEHAALRILGTDVRAGYLSGYCPWAKPSSVSFRLPRPPRRGKAGPVSCWVTCWLHYHGSRSLLLALPVSPWRPGIDVWHSEVIILTLAAVSGQSHRDMVTRACRRSWSEIMILMTDEVFSRVRIRRLCSIQSITNKTYIYICVCILYIMFQRQLSTWGKKPITRVLYSKHNLYVESKFYELQEIIGDSPSNTKAGWIF